MDNRKHTRSSQNREQNSNWRGGRLVASNGYILIRVGTDHPLSDVRGYAYEHRVVASQMLGRIISKNEIVHHINGNKQDNRPDNLEIVASRAHHHARHRSGKNFLKLPDEENTFTECACGCKTKFLRYDAKGRLRKYVSGHNTKGRYEQDNYRMV